VTDPFPPVGEQPWGLRFTRRGLDDIGATSAWRHPGDVQAVRRVSTYPRVVDDFVHKQLDLPDAPGEPLHSVGRPDIVSLHSAAGGRAITWHDPDDVRLVNDCRELLGLHRVDELVPTDDRLSAWTPPAARPSF
jgi:hypothetical protein